MTTDAPVYPKETLASPGRLRRRADFVRATKAGLRHSGRLFTLQMVGQTAGKGADDDKAAACEAASARVGFTVTRKVAGAVGRNRIRRRLKEALRVSDALDAQGALGARPGRDYVFVARSGALTASFTDILTEMAESFSRLNDRGAADARRKRKDGLKGL